MPKRIRSDVRSRSNTFIRDWRQHRKLTQTQLAERVNTTAATISRIEKGEMPYTQDTLEVIAAGLQTTPAALISRRPGHGQAQEDQLLWLIVQKATVDQRRQITALAQILVGADLGLREPSQSQQTRGV